MPIIFVVAGTAKSHFILGGYAVPQYLSDENHANLQRCPQFSL